jgi:hypothetical protein
MGHVLDMGSFSSNNLFKLPARPISHQGKIAISLLDFVADFISIRIFYFT